MNHQRKCHSVGQAAAVTATGVGSGRAATVGTLGPSPQQQGQTTSGDVPPTASAPSQTSSNAGPGDLVPCPECGQQFRRGRPLAVHRRQQCNAPLVRCDKCGGSFKVGAGIRNHHRTCNGVGNAGVRERDERVAGSSATRPAEEATADEGARPTASRAPTTRPPATSTAEGSVVEEETRTTRPPATSSAAAAAAANGEARAAVESHVTPAADSRMQAVPCASCGALFKPGRSLKLHQSRWCKGSRPQ